MVETEEPPRYYDTQGFAEKLTCPKLDQRGYWRQQQQGIVCDPRREHVFHPRAAKQHRTGDFI